MFMNISEDGFNCYEGTIICGNDELAECRMSANQGCNTAKGVLFAAPFFKYIMDGEVLLQYRERAEPFAAEGMPDGDLSEATALQYRERAEPFAARRRW